MKTLKPFLVFICCSYLFWGCERDDICSEAFQVTPRLIIEFYDINETETLKNVSDLSIVAFGEEDTIDIGTVNKISIPLRTDQESTRYSFIRSASNDEFINADELNFIYANRNVYVNRACGFKNEFLDFQAFRILEDNPENNWIRSLEIIQTSIENDQQEEDTHLFIFH